MQRDNLNLNGRLKEIQARNKVIFNLLYLNCKNSLSYQLKVKKRKA